MRFEILVNLRNSAAPLTGSDDLDVTGDQTGGTSNEDGDENNDGGPNMMPTNWIDADLVSPDSNPLFAIIIDSSADVRNDRYDNGMGSLEPGSGATYERSTRDVLGRLRRAQ